MKKRILFIGESWLGSCARSLKEALARQADIELDEMALEPFFPSPYSVWLRALNRLTRPLYNREFKEQVLNKIRLTRPDVVMTYKGHPIHTDLIAAIQRLGPMMVNVYPDYSPHAYGTAHRKAVGHYDLVISTKAYHPAIWKAVYGYDNRCEFVPQGYDPALHLVSSPPVNFEFDVVMVSTYRAEYGKLMSDLAHQLNDSNIRVAVAGCGWEACRSSLPSHWVFPGPVQGRGYVSMLRKGKICIAPLTREVVIDGRRQPGDVDTTRSYELAAAGCFFIHRRTEFAQRLYDETAEVPMYDTPEELAEKIAYFLPRADERAAMAAAAHRRAVPAYSLDARASEIVSILSGALGENKHRGKASA